MGAIDYLREHGLDAKVKGNRLIVSPATKLTADVRSYIKLHRLELMAEAAACGVAKTQSLLDGVNMADFIGHYVSREHRDDRSGGCTLAALCGDAARQPEAIKTTFATGLESILADLLGADSAHTEEARRDARARAIDTIAHALGALVLSRACPDDSPLADEILDTCRTAILDSGSAPLTTV